MQTAVQEKGKGKGVYTFTKNRLETPEQFALSAKIAFFKSRGQEYMPLVRELNDLSKRLGLQEITVIENLVPTVGRGNICDNMTNASPTYSLLINKFAVGTGTNTPANGDTQLQTETYRNDVASRTSAANIAYVTGFLNATESTGTYREAGLFSNGTASANTGALMSRVAINITKTITETLTMDWTFTLT